MPKTPEQMDATEADPSKALPGQLGPDPADSTVRRDLAQKTLRRMSQDYGRPLARTDIPKSHYSHYETYVFSDPEQMSRLFSEGVLGWGGQKNLDEARAEAIKKAYAPKATEPTTDTNQEG